MLFLVIHITNNIGLSGVWLVIPGILALMLDGNFEGWRFALYAEITAAGAAVMSALLTVFCLPEGASRLHE